MDSDLQLAIPDRIFKNNSRRILATQAINYMLELCKRHCELKHVALRMTLKVKRFSNKEAFLYLAASHHISILGGAF
jgi:hypothetical protein